MFNHAFILNVCQLQVIVKWKNDFIRKLINPALSFVGQMEWKLKLLK